MPAPLQSSDALIHACVHSGEAAAWSDFVQRFQRVIAVTALRTARSWNETSPSVLDDLVQETYLKLCADNYRLLREFKPNHESAIYGYLKVVTANVVHDYFRVLHADKRGFDRTEAQEEHSELATALGSLASPATIEREVLLNEIDQKVRECAKGKNAERDRTVFWLHFRHGMTAPQIASVAELGLGTKGVESVLLRLTRAVRGAIEQSRRTGALDSSKNRGISSAESF
jgi:RNA polymerase sigma-70 factor (ECF subfamily)